ncbi:DUF3574 domain-containing protein [Streptomyces sp. NPDC020875]|uniref:DUF3574 domain-containing protein n=1 Tax=Streptomyces sp. NPDC020875 TaxID=3154898 RepID=UPI0033E9DBEE
MKPLGLIGPTGPVSTSVTLAVGAVLALAGTVATASAAVPVARAPQTRYVETQLFFGTARPDGGPEVTPREFRAFLDTTITGRFPAGLTVQEGRGQYRDRFGVIESERSYEVILFYPRSAAGAADTDIEEIRHLYNRRFAQEPVARVDQDVRVDF